MKITTKQLKRLIRETVDKQIEMQFGQTGGRPGEWMGGGDPPNRPIASVTRQISDGLGALNDHIQNMLNYMDRLELANELDGIVENLRNR